MRLAATLMTAALVVSIVPQAAAAQAPVRSFAELARHPDVQPGKDVFVTFAPQPGSAPESFRVEVLGINGASMRVKMDAAFAARRTDLAVERVGPGDNPVFAALPYTIVEVPGHRVLRVGKIDGLGNGAAIGAGVGAVPALLGAAAACSYDGDCVAAAAIGTVVSVSIGMGIGVALDAARRREGETLYEAPERLSSTRFTVAPIVARQRKGAMFVIRW